MYNYLLIIFWKKNFIFVRESQNENVFVVVNVILMWQKLRFSSEKRQNGLKRSSRQK